MNADASQLQNARKTPTNFNWPANIEMEPTLQTIRAIMPPRRAAHFAR